MIWIWPAIKGVQGKHQRQWQRQQKFQQRTRATTTTATHNDIRITQDNDDLWITGILIMILVHDKQIKYHRNVVHHIVIILVWWLHCYDWHTQQNQVTNEAYQNQQIVGVQVNKKRQFWGLPVAATHPVNQWKYTIFKKIFENIVMINCQSSATSSNQTDIKHTNYKPALNRKGPRWQWSSFKTIFPKTNQIKKI